MNIVHRRCRRIFAFAVVICNCLNINFASLLSNVCLLLSIVCLFVYILYILFVCSKLFFSPDPARGYWHLQWTHFAGQLRKVRYQKPLNQKTIQTYTIKKTFLSCFALKMKIIKQIKKLEQMNDLHAGGRVKLTARSAEEKKENIKQGTSLLETLQIQVRPGQGGLEK